MPSKRERELQREAEDLLEQIAAAKRGPIVLEVVFDVTPAAPTTREERQARAMPSSKPLPAAAAIAAPRVAATNDVAKEAARRTPRGPVSPYAWRSQKSLSRQSNSAGINRDF